jgi:hypothetical protein
MRGFVKVIFLILQIRPQKLWKQIRYSGFEIDNNNPDARIISVSNDKIHGVISVQWKRFLMRLRFDKLRRTRRHMKILKRRRLSQNY